MLSPRPRSLHALSVLAVSAAIALAGCGGGDDEASSPLDEALGYLSEDTGFAFVASTDVGEYDDVRKLLEKFPFGGQLEESLKQSLSAEDLDFEDDIEPLLGNELVVGTDDNASLVNSDQDTPVILAIETRDGDKLEELVKKTAESQGDSEGYDLYQDGDSWLAIKDDVLVQTEGEDRLKAALEQRGDGDRLTEDDVEPALEDLPEDALLKGYVNLGALLAADPDTKEALKVKWVEHLETLGFTVDASDEEVAIEYSLQTDPEGLSDDDLPIASGSEAPRLLDREGAEVVFSLRDPKQVVDFALAAAKVVDPAGYAQFQAGKAAIERRLEIDVDDDVIAQLGDLAAAATIGGKFGVRAEVADRAVFERTLAKIMDRLPEFSDDVTVAPPEGDGFYRLTTEDGETFAVGVAEGSLVVASDEEFASDIASRGLVEADGQGALVAAADAERIANEALAQFAGGLEGLGGSLFTGPLGDLASSAEAATDGITGSLKLEIE